MKKGQAYQKGTRKNNDRIRGSFEPQDKFEVYNPEQDQQDKIKREDIKLVKAEH